MSVEGQDSSLILGSEGHGDGSENPGVYNGMSVDAQSSRNGIDTGLWMSITFVVKMERGPAKLQCFFEGFPKPLDCTILLKGADRINELKKIKHVTTRKNAHGQMPSISDVGAKKPSTSPEFDTDVSSTGDGINCRDLYFDKPCKNGIPKSDSSTLLEPSQLVSSVPLMTSMTQAAEPKIFLMQVLLKLEVQQGRFLIDPHLRSIHYLFLEQDCTSKLADVSTPTGSSKSGQVACIPISDDIQVDRSIQVARETYAEKDADLELKADKPASSGLAPVMPLSKEHLRMSRGSAISK
ncbi:hypothetical protein COCNU_scaffold001294G000010 [Cocos nucifera]|nr:hypothetical protein [Cocos nucifera]